MSDLPLDRDTLARARDVAVAAARAAADGPILSLFRSPALHVESKGDASPVSEADRAAELLIRERLTTAFPGIPVFGEEFGDGGHAGAADARLRWVVDPIDGTISFVRGVPLFGTIVGLEDTRTGRTLAGVLHLPALGETYAAAAGLGCLCDGDPVRLPDAPPGRGPTLVAAGDRAWFAECGLDDDYAKLSAAHPFLRGYTDCFGHAMVLRGAASVMVDPGLSSWDVVATKVLVPEAGGRVWTRASGAGAGKVDLVIGSAGAVGDVLELLGWS